MDSVDYPFFVYVVESPSDRDIYNGTSEGEMICGAVSLNQIICESKIVTTKAILSQALTTDLYKTIERYEYKKLPIIHFSCHGHRDGFGLTSGEHATWEEVRLLLVGLNQVMRNKLLLCMSSCKGLGAVQQCFQLDRNNFSFGGIVGNLEDISWSDTVIGFTTFYHHIIKGKSLVEAVEKMKIASDNNSFHYIKSEEARHFYLMSSLEQLQQETDRIQENINRINQPTNLNPQSDQVANQ